MSGVRLRNGYVEIDGTPTFLFGGELHYFRVPRAEWGRRLVTLKATGANLVSTYIPWSWHEAEEGHIDVTGETSPERDLNAFLQLVKEYGLYCIVRPGPYVMAELKQEGVPAWLPQRYSEVIAKTRNGEPHPSRVLSYLHPVYLEKVRRWYDSVISVISGHLHTRGGSVIMVQLCNEIAMLHWVCRQADHNEATLDHFETYLQEQYRDIETANARFGTVAQTFHELSRRFHELDTLEAHREWSQFWREFVLQYAKRLKEMADRNGIDVPYLINVHGFRDVDVCGRGSWYPEALSQLYLMSNLENALLAGDFYPGHVGYDTFHDLALATEFTRAIQGADIPFISAEFQSGRLSDRPRVYPQDLDLITRTCVAHGMNGLNYYMFFGGKNPEALGANLGIFGPRHEWQAPVDSQGRPRPSYHTAARLGSMLQAVGRKLVESPKSAITHLAFYPDYYMTDYVDERPKVKRELGGLIYERDAHYFDGVARLLVAANLHPAAVDIQAPRELDPREIPHLWVFSDREMDRAVQERLLRYVEQGGTLFLTPQVPERTLTGEACTVLADGLGISPCKEREYGWPLVEVGDLKDLPVRVVMHTQVQGESQVIARMPDGRACGYVKCVGNGRVVMIAFTLTQDLNPHLDMIRALASVGGVTPRWTAGDPSVSVVERASTTEETSFVFVLNYDETPYQVTLSKDGEPQFGGATIDLAPRSGMTLPRNLRLADGLVLRYATAEVVGINAGAAGTASEGAGLEGATAGVAAAGGTHVELQLAGTVHTVAELCIEGHAVEVSGAGVTSSERNGDVLVVRVRVSNQPGSITVKSQVPVRT